MDDWKDRWIAERVRRMAYTVRQKCERVAERFGLSLADRDDLEQEVWLALLTRWREPDEPSRPPIDVATLARQIGRLFAACRFGNGLRDLQAVAAEPARQSAADLRIDLADLLAQLSAEDQQFCAQWMNESLSATHPPGTPPPFTRLTLFDSAFLSALRAVFEAAGMRVYL